MTVSPGRPVLVFDGDCGFCTLWARRWQRWWRLEHVEPYQFVDLDELGVTAEACAQAVQWVGVDGSVHAAEHAVVAALRYRGGMWALVGRAMALPGVIHLAGVVYRLVARYRFRLPGATPACQIGER